MDEVEETLPLDTNVGHLQKEPVEIVCPACNAAGLSTLRQEVVTGTQKFIAAINFCCCCTPIKWEGRHDFNHYCSKCGCFIGRQLTLNWYERLVFRCRRSTLESSAKSQKYQDRLYARIRSEKEAEKNEQ